MLLEKCEAGKEERGWPEFYKTGVVVVGSHTFKWPRYSFCKKTVKIKRVNYTEMQRKNFPIREDSKLKSPRQELVYLFRGISRWPVVLTKEVWKKCRVRELVKSSWIVWDFTDHLRVFCCTQRHETTKKFEEKNNVIIIEMIRHVILERGWFFSPGIKVRVRNWGEELSVNCTCV